jgi:hypothetical protein
VYHFQNNPKTNGVEGTNMGLAQTIGDGTEHPKSAKARYQQFIHCQNSIIKKLIQFNQILPNWSITKHQPSKANQTQEE